MELTETVVASAALVIVGLSSSASAFDSGSTATDDFAPAVSTTVQLPENGILQYRNITIPSGVTIAFGKNTSNTPVTLLASGDVTIAGKIDVSGGMPTRIGPLGDGNLFDDGQPGRGGPGGYDGGAGGRPSTTLSDRIGGAGLGPGGSGPIGPQYFGIQDGRGPDFLGVGGAGFASSGVSDQSRTVGRVYGTPELLPLIGGSGGGGGHSNGVYSGGGGSGGGGAILIAASGTLTLSPGALIQANGGNGWNTTGLGSGQGGCGSGGAVRLVASRLIAAGARIEAYGGDIGTPLYQSGGGGRVRIEADQIGSLPSVDIFGPGSGSYVVARQGTVTSGPAGPVFLPNAPSLRFLTIGGLTVPAIPTGAGDVTLPDTAIDPVSITLRTTGIPSGSVIQVVVAPANGLPTTTNTSPTVGSVSSADGSASVAIPVGHSTLQASVTFTLTLAQAGPFTRFAEGERVEKVTLTSTLGKGNQATLHTATGREFPIEPSLLALAALSH